LDINKGNNILLFYIAILHYKHCDKCVFVNFCHRFSVALVTMLVAAIMAQPQEQQQNNDNAAAEETHVGATHSIVTYLGNDFILRDGCKLEECNARDRYKY